MNDQFTPDNELSQDDQENVSGGFGDVGFGPNEPVTPNVTGRIYLELKKTTCPNCHASNSLHSEEPAIHLGCGLCRVLIHCRECDRNMEFEYAIGLSKGLGFLRYL